MQPPAQSTAAVTGPAPTSNLLLTSNVQDSKPAMAMMTTQELSDEKEKCMRNYSGIECDPSTCNRKHASAKFEY